MSRAHCGYCAHPLTVSVHIRVDKDKSNTITFDELVFAADEDMFMKIKSPLSE